MPYVDLRSDTVTVPSPAMREFIAQAEVGDDVYGEDPTVNALQEKITELTGKEAALFVTSGTQANQIALNAHTNPGDEVICEYASHTFNFEAGASAMLGGIQLHPLRGKRGVLDTVEIEQCIRPDDHHFPKTKVISIENTHNRSGGAVYPLKEMQKVRELASRHGLLVHLDGARLWNAATATGISVHDYAQYTDSVSLCFSKGLGAPAGSILAGSHRFIERAHYYRKAYGGGLRQAGLLAAGALFAIKHHFPLLKEDHRRAARFADFLNRTEIFKTEPVETNIILFSVNGTTYSAQQVSTELKKAGILISAISDRYLRAVTHLGISDEDLQTAEDVVNRLFN